MKRRRAPRQITRVGVRSPTRALIVAALALGIAACSGTGGESTPTTNQPPVATASQSAPATRSPLGNDAVTLVLDWTPNTNHGGIYLAAANGWYEDAGIDLHIIEPGEVGGLQAVAAGKAEFAISVQEDVTPARANGAPVRSIAAIIQHNTSSLLSLTPSGITEPADLAGHRYGGWGGQLEHALIEALVTCTGGDPSSVQFIDVGNADYRVGLEQDRYDVVWVFDGWDKIRLQQADVDVSTIEFDDYPDCIPDWYTPLIATSDGLIAERPELVQTFIDVTVRGYRAAIADPAAAADALLAAAPELDPKLVRASAEYLSTRYSDDPARWGHQDPAVWTEFTDFLVGAGLVNPSLDPTAAYTNRFIDQAESVSDGAAITDPALSAPASTATG